MTKDTSEKAMADSSRDFFRPSTFATLAGTTTAVVLLANTTAAVTGREPTWEPLVYAVICSFGAYLYAARGKSGQFHKTPWALRYAMVVLNGCLIYTTSFGVQVVAASETVSDREDTGIRYAITDWQPIFALGNAPKRQVSGVVKPHGDQ